MKKVFVLFVSVLLGWVGPGRTCAEQQPLRRLTPQQVVRLEECHRFLKEVERDSLEEMVAWLEKTAHPEENLKLKESIAAAYTDIVQELNVLKHQRKKRLYEMIMLNMAYLQLGDGQKASGGNIPLNRLICRKLKKYLPPELFDNPAIFTPIEEY